MVTARPFVFRMTRTDDVYLHLKVKSTRASCVAELEHWNVCRHTGWIA